MLFLGQLPLGLQPAVAADVHHLVAALGEHPADQQPPVTTRGVLLAAENHHPPILGQRQQPRQRLLEWIGLGQLAVEHVAADIVELAPLGPAPQCVAEKAVGEPLGVKMIGQHFLVELVGITRIGARADVDHQVDAVPAEQADECL